MNRTSTKTLWITFTPQTDPRGRFGWAYRAEGSVSKLLSGVLPGLHERWRPQHSAVSQKSTTRDDRAEQIERKK